MRVHCTGAKRNGELACQEKEVTCNLPTLGTHTVSLVTRMNGQCNTS